MYQIPEANRRMMESLQKMRQSKNKFHGQSPVSGPSDDGLFQVSGFRFQVSGGTGSQEQGTGNHEGFKFHGQSPVSGPSDDGLFQVSSFKFQVSGGTGNQEQGTRSKQQEFPGIDWDDTLKPDIQLCQLLYNERVRTYQKMKQMLESVSEAEQESVAPDFGKQFAKLDDSNRLAQQELESYNSTGQFLMEHPIAKKFKK